MRVSIFVFACYFCFCWGFLLFFGRGTFIYLFIRLFVCLFFLVFFCFFLGGAGVRGVFWGVGFVLSYFCF